MRYYKKWIKGLPKKPGTYSNLKLYSIIIDTNDRLWFTWKNFWYTYVKGYPVDDE